MLELRRRKRTNGAGLDGKGNKGTNAREETSRRSAGEGGILCCFIRVGTPPFAAWKDAGNHERHTKPSYMNKFSFSP
jgi:hypothetical protein